MADRESFDLFLGDLAAGQSHREVTPRANQALAAELFERLDQKRAEQEGRLAPAPAPPPAPTADAEPRAADLEAKRRGYRILRGGDLSPSAAGNGANETPLIATWTQREQWYYAAVSARVKLLLRHPESGPLGQPSWRDRALAVLSLAATGQRQLAAHQMAELCRDSEAVFGSMFIERLPKVFVGGAR